MIEYSLGAVGFGHWFSRLYRGISKSNEIKLSKVAGVSSFEGKADRLRTMGLDRRHYYRMVPEEGIPEEFFEGLDIVHISDPNQFHAEQTIESLSKGKITITEKTLGVNKQEFVKVMDYIRENGYEKKAYLHLHYMHKLLTMELPGQLMKYAKEHGKVRSVSTVFFEKAGDEDSRRKSWLFSKESGGLFMDWIHPFEILYLGCAADRVDLNGVELYAINKEYDSVNPTGIRAEISLEGRFFSGDATAEMKVAKGVGYSRKTVRLLFESGATLNLNYADSESEFSSSERGTWALYDGGKVVESGAPMGPDTSELLVNDMLDMCNGRRAGLEMGMLEKIFEPQWQYQKISAGIRIRSEDEELKKFYEVGGTLPPMSEG